MLLIDVAASFGLTGRQAENLLRDARLTVSRNAIPQDVNGPWYTSGVRMGTAALTTLGMKEEELREVASILIDLLKEAKPDGTSRAKALVEKKVLLRAHERIEQLLVRFPLYPELVL